MRCLSFFLPIILLLNIQLSHNIFHIMYIIILPLNHKSMHNQREIVVQVYYYSGIIIIIGMFILSNIKVNTSEVLFFPHSRKFLKFQINKSTKKHPFPSKFISPHEIHWDAELTFPEALYGKTISFQIYIKHEFGYNEEELNSMLQGEMKVERDDSVQTFEIHRPDDPQIIGYLSCRVRHKLRSVEEIIETKIAKKQLLTIKSIIAHVPAAVNKKIFCKFTVGHQEVKTTPIRTICGDLVFADRLTVNKTDLDMMGSLLIFEIRDDCEVKLGEGRMNLLGTKPEKKVTLLSLRDELLGEAYVDCIQEQAQRLRSSSLSSYLHKIKPSRDIAMSNTSMSGRVTGFKKISVVSPNQSIVFSTSQRFKQIANPEFMNTRSSNKSKYSLGQLRILKRGQNSKQKGLFSIEEQSPGVGSYNLPTIWDRY